MAKLSSLLEFGRISAITSWRLAAFTLSEMMLSITILMIVSAMALPVWQSIQRRQHLRLQLNQLNTMMRFAQMTALSRREVITLCGSHGLSCDGDWQAGLLVVIGNNQAKLRYVRRDFKRWRLSWRGSFGCNDYLKFAPSGFTLGQQGRFYLCGQDSPESDRAIVVSHSGRQRLDQGPKVKQYCNSRS
ncbi:MAG: GspH/FimT family pseudopilin [Coxiellaceae bacterium]|nr:GspH/FimT family pseudopilin [Coxiellaceae bacterium]